MPAAKPDTPLAPSPAVEDFLAALDHPLAKEIAQVRKVILQADPRLREGVKWNAPSFFHHDWFATFHLRSAKEVVVILHLGAKTKAPLKARFVEDTAGLITWITNDRGKVAFTSAAEIEAKAASLQRLIRQWLDAMDADAPTA